VQLADWVIREASDFTATGLVGQFDRLKFHRMVKPGDQIHLQVERMAEEGSSVSFRGRASVDGQLVTAARFQLEVEALAPLHHPDKARKLFAVIYRPKEEASGPRAVGESA
jgi:acyl dehydratase